MADPVSLALISLAGTAIGGGVSAFGAFQGGKASQAMYNYQSRVAQINAGIANEQANIDLVTGEQRAQVSGLRTGEKVGLTRAGIGAGNLDLGTGSARRVVGSEVEIGQYEGASIRNDAARRAYASRVSAFGDEAQAGLDVAAGEGARTAAEFGAAGSLLGGATSVADKWTKFSQAGLDPLTAPFGTGG